MRLCLLAPEFPPVWGGVGTYAFELVKNLPKDIEIHVVTPQRLTFGAHRIAKTDEYPIDVGDNVHIHYISKANDSFSYNAFFQFACLTFVPNLIKKEGIQIIHSHAAQMPDLLLMFRKLDVPIVTTIHTTIGFQRAATKATNRNVTEMEESERATYYLYPFLRLSEEVYFKTRRSYITPSNWMKNWFYNKFSKTNVTVIPNCVNLRDYQSVKRSGYTDKLIPADFQGKRVILYFGRLLALKGIDVLINAIPEISRNFGSGELLYLFAGPGDSSKYIQKIQKFSGSTEYLFLGPLSRELIAELIQISEIVVVPSFNENCPYSVLEAMASGKPVIASNVGGIPEIITNDYDGVLVNPGNSEALAKAIIRTLQDKKLQDQLGERAKFTIAKKFSWETNIPNYIRTYNNAINRYS
jgi:glycosyltransferase involved in cell wall biosynthesis